MEDKNQDPKSKPKKAISRRSFIRGAGLSTAGSVLLTTNALAFEYDEQGTFKFNLLIKAIFPYQ